jgi:hypothetical protein
MRIAIYTSFAVNYLAKARVLVQSIKAIAPEIDIIGIVCDRFPPNIDATGEAFDDLWMVDEYPASPVVAWIFEHNIMELCTAVKGWGLMRLLQSGYDFVFYLDPDCWVLEDPRQIIGLLEREMSILVVPHTTSPAQTSEGIRLIEISSLKHGIYNLGFLMVRNDDNGRRFAEWWAARLRGFCFADFDSGIFTDQRWFDLAVGYFPFIQVAWHKGIDVASWNIGQRAIARSNTGGYLVDGDPLVFYHFSGVGPAGVHRWVRDIFAPSDPLAAELEFRYEELINAAGQKELAEVSPFYDRFDDGALIEASDREQFRKSEEFAKKFPNPYVTSGTDNFRRAARPEAGSSLVRAQRKLSDSEIESVAFRLFDPNAFRSGAGRSKLTRSALWLHYKRLGWSRSSTPNNYFDVRYYIAQLNPSQASSFETPLHHYVGAGKEMGLAPVWFFDEKFYLDVYADVRDAVENKTIFSGYEHYMNSGRKEGRKSSSFFYESQYLQLNPDVREAVNLGHWRNGGDHYFYYGHREGRRGGLLASTKEL